MKQEEFNKILLKYEAGQCTEDERSRVELWYKNLQLPKDIIDPAKTESQLFERINANLEKRIKVRWQVMAAGIAAVLLVAAGLSFYFLSTSANYSQMLTKEDFIVDEAAGPIINKTSSPQLVTLSDGTKITLEPDGKLTVTTFTKSVRQVRLQGKAFFDVAHQAQRPFYVYTENLVTKVLGTSFIINTIAAGGETVEVKTGRVAVFPKEQKGNTATKYYVTITPNLQVEYNKLRKELISSVVKHPRIIVPTLVGVRHAKTSSANGTSSFVMQYEETPVSEILKALEEAYGVKIIFDKSKLSSCLLTVNLKDEDLFTRLQAVCHAIGGSYQVAGTMIVVNSKGC